MRKWKPNNENFAYMMQAGKEKQQFDHINPQQEREKQMSTRSGRFSRPLSDPKRYETTKAQITSSRVRRLHRAVDKAARWDCISPTISTILFGRTRVQPE